MVRAAGCRPRRTVTDVTPWRGGRGATIADRVERSLMKSSRAPQMFITALQMRHWRNFRGPVDVRLRRRAFLIGSNASGKSNVLDALRFLRDTAGKGLKEAVRLRGGMGEIRTLQARTPAGLKLAVHVGTDDMPHMWTYSLGFRNHPQKHLPVVMEEEVRKQDERVSATGGRARRASTNARSRTARCA